MFFIGVLFLAISCRSFADSYLVGEVISGDSFPSEDRAGTIGERSISTFLSSGYLSGS